MITAEEYRALLNQPPPDDFTCLAAQADAEINRATLYGLIGRDTDSFPEFVRNELNLAYAYQIQFLSENRDTINSAGAQSFSLGKFSMTAAADSEEKRALAPMTSGCLVTVNAFLRGLR